MPQSDPTQKYIRETCRELDSRYDREALWILCGAGVFSVDDPAKIDEAVARLVGEPESVSSKIVALQQVVKNGQTVEKRWAAFQKLDNLDNERLTESVEAAYLLGIAVGRRLGPAALHVAGAAR